MRNVLAALLLLCSTPALAQQAAASAPKVARQADAPIEVVYDWSREKCELWDIPDAPLRAFRNDRGQVMAYVSDSKGRLYTGADLLTLRHTCDTTFSGRNSANPADFNAVAFITATWTADGRHVAALIHEEYHADRYKTCTFKSEMQCWYNTVIAGTSSDGGHTFSVATPPLLVIAPGFRQDVEQGRHRGFFNPSNIFAKDGAWYALAGTTGGQGQKPGQCLLRSPDPADATSWRAYDGKDFTIRAVNPYGEGREPYRPCVPVQGLSGTVTVVRHVPSGLYLAVYQTGAEPGYPNGRIAYAWSSDLLRWSKPETLLNVSSMPSKDCMDQYRYGYPAVADPASDSRNFDTIGAAPYLFLTRFHVEKCGLPPNRDLVRVKLRID